MLNHLPLKVRTPVDWVTHIQTDILTFLDDHAHLEKKAANNALSLSNYFFSSDLMAWNEDMSIIVIEEMAHFKKVLKHLKERGGKYKIANKNVYAQKLGKILIRQGISKKEILDKMLVSAMIELRSYERISLLAHHLADKGLRLFYHSLSRSEENHYQTFLNWAYQVNLKKEVEKRWEVVCIEEGEIIKSLPLSCTMHSGLRGLLNYEQ